MFVLFTTVTHQ